MQHQLAVELHANTCLAMYDAHRAQFLTLINCSIGLGTYHRCASVGELGAGRVMLRLKNEHISHEPGNVLARLITQGQVDRLNGGLLSTGCCREKEEYHHR